MGSGFKGLGCRGLEPRGLGMLGCGINFGLMCVGLILCLCWVLRL